MTKTVIVPAGVELQYVEDFPKGAERSVEGSLHVRPATTLHLTQDEWAHIEKAHPELAKRLILVKETPTLEHHIQRQERAASGAAGSPPGGSATTAPPADTPPSARQEESENAQAVPPRGPTESGAPADPSTGRTAELRGDESAPRAPMPASPDPEKSAYRSGSREPPIIPDPRNRGR